jgi:hypothetical protein
MSSEGLDSVEEVTVLLSGLEITISARRLPVGALHLQELEYQLVELQYLATPLRTSAIPTTSHLRLRIVAFKLPLRLNCLN